MRARRHPSDLRATIAGMISGAAIGALTLAPSRALAEDPAPAPKPEEPIEVRVEGEKNPVSTRDPSAASTVLRGERLHQPGQSAADVLAEVPGVQVARTGAASDLATASIRGATSAQTPVYLAGVRLNDDITGTADLSLVPLWMLHRVEVFRGNAPVDADRLGIGGALFFEPTLPRGPKVGGGIGAGSFGELSARVGGAFGDDRASGMVALSRESATNDYPYVDDLRGTGATFTRRNADSVAYDLWGIGRYRIRGGSITTIANGFVRDQGVSGVELSPASAARAHIGRWLGAISAALPCSAQGMDRCRLEVQSSALVVEERFEDPLHQLAINAARATSLGARVSEQARVRYWVNDALSLTVSAAEELEQIAVDRLNVQRARGFRSVTRGAAFATYDLSRTLSINGLGALEYDVLRGPVATSAALPSGRVGARLAINQAVTILANLARYVRVPALGELYGISPTVLGNPDLRPERGVSTDIGARLSTSIAGNAVFLEVFGFSRFASDLISYERDAFRSVRPYNVTSARIFGLEVFASADLFHRIHAEANLTLSDPRDTSGEDGLPSTLLRYQAQVVASPAIEVYQGPIPAIALDRASLGARVNYRSARFASLGAGSPELPPVTTVDLDLSLLFWKKRISAALTLRNLLGVQNSDVLGYPLPGRSVHGAMEVWW